MTRDALIPAPADRRPGDRTKVEIGHYGLRWDHLDEDISTEGLLAAEPIPAPAQYRDREDPAAIIYTSGSTGPPKGGLIAVNFLAAVRPYIRYGLDLREGDILWPTGDPGWGHGFVCYLGGLAAGATLVCLEANPTAETCLSVLARYRVTNLATTPTLLRSLMAFGEEAVRAAPIAVRAISSCGEPLNGKVVPDCRYWLRYWNDPAASEALVQSGWIVAGDLGRMDEEGYFWFEGRVGDMIKSAGYRIGPFEIESALLKHPAVAEAAVVGKPDEARGQIVKAFVTLRDGYVGSDELAATLVELVKTNLGRHQYPRELEIVQSLPKTETGKIQHFTLRERA
ncbi:AMP-binding enzyme [Enterovirga aerilata]|uniref:AMP-binding enzyme n=1 Tax=Enterovirga aerilata TaxID=2730920 RepID=UPI001FED6164|nr:AMP-binding protein [Enterovirga sp. DB1703]